jgi:tRNA1Val (adenine37-N6)-methyltransferase
MIHKPERLADIFESFRKNSIEPKEIMPVISRPDKKPELILIEGRKGGGKELTMHQALYITDEKGSYTPELCRIYGFDRNLKGQ